MMCLANLRLYGIQHPFAHTINAGLRPQMSVSAKRLILPDKGFAKPVPQITHNRAFSASELHPL